MAYSTGAFLPSAAGTSMAAIIRIPSAPVAASSCIRLSNALGVWAGSWARASATIVSAVRWRASCAPAAKGIRAARSMVINIFFMFFSGFGRYQIFHGVRIGWSMSRFAASSPTKSCLSGSKCSVRFRRRAHAPRFTSVELRCPLSSSRAKGSRLRTHARKSVFCGSGSGISAIFSMTSGIVHSKP